MTQEEPWKVRSRKPVLQVTPEERAKRFVTLVPPEGVPLSFELATLTDRMAALLLDLSLIFGSVILLLLFVFFVVFGLLFGGGSSWGGMSSLAILLLCLFVIRQGYFLFFELVWQGTTPGKRYSSIQVVSRDGGSLTVAALISRNLLRDVEVFVPVGLLLSPQQITQLPSWITLPTILWIGIMMAIPLLNRERLRVGDLLGGTMVIRVPKADLQADKARQTSGIKQSPIVFSAKQLAIYGEFELETLADILRKVDQNQAHVDDLRTIAKTIAKKIAYTGSEPLHDPLSFLRVFYAAQRAVLEKKLLFGQRKSSQHSESKDRDSTA